MNFSIKNIATIYISLLMVLKMLALPYICMQFQSNKDYIAAYLCENKDRPAINCYGTCQLNKQVAKTGEHPDAHSEKGGVKTISIDFFQHIEVLAIPAVVHTDRSFPSYYNTFFSAGHTGSIFHPPSTVA